MSVCVCLKCVCVICGRLYDVVCIELVLFVVFVYVLVLLLRSSRVCLFVVYRVMLHGLNVLCFVCAWCMACVVLFVCSCVC